METKTYFIGFKDDDLRTIYIEEYLPWTKTGILKDGELRKLYNKLEENNGKSPTTIILVERIFINECARRFANVGI